MAKLSLKAKNGPLVAVVASVAVAAVVIGSAVAYWQGPDDKLTEAGPLPGTSSTPSTTPSTTPKPTVTPRPTPKPTPALPPKPSTTPRPSTTTTSTGPTTVELTVSKLPGGRAPQIPYQVGGEVRGGAGQARKIPDGTFLVGRMNTDVMAVVSTGEGKSELQRISYGAPRRTPGVSSLVISADQSAAAYAVGTLSNRGPITKGGAVYAETGSIRKLDLPNSWEVEVLAYRGGKVYFRAGNNEKGDRLLYEWTPGTTKATAIPAVKLATAVSPDGTVAASMGLLNDAGTCSTITAIATGKQLWRTCENQLRSFTPDSRTVIGSDAYGDGYCGREVAALDATTGRLIRKWKGCFQDFAAEDDQHVLIVAVASGGGGDPGTKSAIIRCDISTGQCERATPITVDLPLSLGR
ncbi:hypothetical protein GCM10009554_36180 [Kribbella koreensis]|uniref:Pyrroloquinoline-quinone binding quinoprotein n=1 Tax=Kribbella koreensis TaxID=57909 RepID=A0ABP4AY22_9ACTN